MSVNYDYKKKVKKRIAQLLSEFKREWSEYAWVKHISMLVTGIEDRGFTVRFTYKNFDLDLPGYFKFVPHIGSEIVCRSLEQHSSRFARIDKQIILNAMMKRYGNKK